MKYKNDTSALANALTAALMVFGLSCVMALFSWIENTTLF